MKAERLLSTLLLLQAHGAMRGARGGWRLDENWRTRVPGLAEDELRALVMTQPRVMGDTGLA
jgi:hypothetical protein